MKTLFTLLFALTAAIATGQTHKQLSDYKPTAEYENVHVLKISEDDHQSSFIIWVKDSVPEHQHQHSHVYGGGGPPPGSEHHDAHYHADHSENIVVISGKAIMTLDGKTITVKKGDFLNIPEGTKHSVKEVSSHGPLKVLSIQTPLFSGKDRIFTKPKND